MNSLLEKKPAERGSADSVEIDWSDVRRLWPERLGHLQRVAGVVAGVGGFGGCSWGVRVEVVDRLHSKAFGVYTPGLVELDSYNPGWAAGTLVHELGHHISLNGGAVMTENGFMLHVRVVGLTLWKDAVLSSEHYKRVEKDVYLGDWRELFARAYFQWVAVRSGDPVLLQQLEEMTVASNGEYQWGTGEFVPIGLALDAYFENDKRTGG